MTVDLEAKAKERAVAALMGAPPANGTVIALDPDIPPRHQRLHLQAELRRLNGERRRPTG